MTVAVQTPISSYTGNGVTTAFSFGYYVAAQGDLVVMVDGVVKALTTDYTLTGIGSGGGGTCTFVTAPASGADVVLYRDTDLLRDTDYQDNGDLLAAILNGDFDRIWLALQETITGAKLSPRAVRAPVGETLNELPDATTRAGKILTFNATTGQPEAVAPTSGTATDLAIQLASTANGDGASLVGIEDPLSYYSGTTVESALAQVGPQVRGIVGFPNDGTSFQTWAAANPTAQLMFPNVSATVTDAQLVSGDVIGRGPRESIMTAGGPNSVLKLGDSTNPNLWSWRRVQGIQIQGNAKASDGIEYNSATATPYFSGRWIIDGVTIEDCDKAIHKPIGSIGQLHSALCLSGNNYGYYALSGVGSGSGMHTGADLFVMGELSANAIAAYYVNATQGGPGGNRLNGTVIENNPGFGIALENYSTCYTPFVMDAVWFENNATSGTVTLPVAGSVAPVDLYVNAAPHVVLTNGILPKIRLTAAAHLNVSNSFLSADKSTYSIDSTSWAGADNVHIDGGAHPIVIRNVVSIRRALGNFAARWRGLPRDAVAKRHTGTVLEAKSWANRNTEVFSGTSNVAGNITADGRIFDSCIELVIPSGNTNNLGASVTITSGKWYFLSLDVKPVSGTASALVIQSVNGGTAFAGLDDVMDTAARWTTICAAGSASSGFTARLTVQNTDASSVTLRVSAYQLIEFDTEPEMLDFINSRAYDPGSTYPRILYGTAAPTTGTWSVGDTLFNIAPAVGAAKAWSCTVAGTPGTWVSQGNL